MLPGALGPEGGARVKWCLVSTAIMAVAWNVANAVPLFSDLVSVTGGALCPQYAFTFPPLFYLAILQKGKLGPRSAKHTAMAVASVMTLLLSAWCTFVGTASSIIVL